jgi:hypothetical protein
MRTLREMSPTIIDRRADNDTSRHINITDMRILITKRHKTVKRQRFELRLRMSMW